MRPAIAKIEPTIICEQSLDDDERIISPLPLPPPRKNSIRSKTSPDLDDIQIEESIPRHNAAFKRVIYLNRLINFQTAKNEFEFKVRGL